MTNESKSGNKQVLNKKCVPCEGIGQALTREQAEVFLKSSPLWQLSEDVKSISRNYVLKDFVQCIQRINQIKDIAESQGHHPDLHLTGYKNLRVVLYTHAVNGLTENDFIVASNINQLG